MRHDDDVKPIEEKVTEVKAGYLVMRLKPGFGIIINNLIEIRISSIKSIYEVQIAVRAPKDLPIRKVR